MFPSVPFLTPQCWAERSQPVIKHAWIRCNIRHRKCCRTSDSKLGAYLGPILVPGTERFRISFYLLFLTFL